MFEEMLQFYIFRFNSFPCIKFEYKYCLRLANVGKLSRRRQVVTGNFLGAQAITLMVLFCTFSRVWEFFLRNSRKREEQYSIIGRIIEV